MNAEYKRDLQNNYLILELDQECIQEGYRLQMAEQNEIPGLLGFHSSGRDGKRYLHYEITSRQTLSSLYERKSLRHHEIRNLLTDIRDAMEGMQRYLLDSSDLIFSPDYIFVGADRRAAFCYFPKKYEENGIAVLAEFILKKLDHEEEAAVMLGYRFYQKVCEENFSLNQLWKELICNHEGHRAEENQIRNGAEAEWDFAAGQMCEADRGRIKNMGQLQQFQTGYGKTSEHLHQEAIAGSRWNSYTETYQKSDTEDRDYSAADEYAVIHKERGRKQSGKKLDWLLERVHPAVLLSGLFLLAMIEILFYFQIIYLTEAGGMFFLMLSAEMLINRFWKSRKEKKKEYRSLEEQEDDLRYEELREEMYADQNMEEIGETCCLTVNSKQQGLRLICAGDARYPDIILSEGAIYVGKRKGESDVILDSPVVSRMHARLDIRDGQCFVKDLNSRNGTYCNGQRLNPQEERAFEEGDQIMFAQIRYKAVQM